MPLGTSSAMESTLLPAKSSCPVHFIPCRAPSTSAKNGSLRSAADSRIPCPSTTTVRSVPSKLTGKESASTWPAGSGCWASEPVAYQTVPVWLPFWYSENVSVNAMSARVSLSVSMLIR